MMILGQAAGTAAALFGGDVARADAQRLTRQLALAGSGAVPCRGAWACYAASRSWSPPLTVPIVVGVLRPMILVPVATVLGLTQDQDVLGADYDSETGPT
jgi:hypothetical protein